MDTVLITGATGLVGGHAAALFRRLGWGVRALVRPSSDTDRLDRLGVECIVGDITRAETLRGSADGCRAVVHGGAHLGSRASWAHHLAVNVDGTRNVVSEAVRAGAERLVHISSVAVYGHPRFHPRRLIDESAPVDVPVAENDYYDRSKRLAEDVVRAIPTDRLAWCVLRPDIVIGEGDRHFTPRIVRIARSGSRIVPSGGTNDLPIVYAGNVARALLLAATADRAIGRVYNVTDDGRLTLRELLETAAGTRRLHFVPVPGVLMEAGLTTLTAVLPSTRRLPINRRNIWFLVNSDPFDGSRIRRELGWAPELSTAAGWERSIRAVAGQGQPL